MTESNTRVPFSFSRGNRTGLLIYVSSDEKLGGDDKGKYRMFIGNSPMSNEPAVLPLCEMITHLRPRNSEPIRKFVVMYKGERTPVDTIDDCTVLVLEDYIFEETDDTVTITKK